MVELWEWVEVYILFQTAVMDESTAKNKNGGGGGRRLHAFTISNSPRQSSVVLKSHYNRWDWNNGTPGERAKADTAAVVCGSVMGRLGV